MPSEKSSRHDSLTRRHSSDPPDHMEERALRKLYSQQHQVSHTPSNQSITWPPEHSLQRHDRAKHCNDDGQRRQSSTKSVSPIRSDPIESYEPSPFSSSCRETGFVVTSKDKKNRIPRVRQMSPHPVDMMKGSAVAAADVTELQQKDRRIVGSPAPHFTLDGALGSSESAEELRRLIESMETEFRRLRQSKLQAEAKAAKLATELNIQQQMMEKRFESLYMENEQLKSALSVSLTELACVMEKLNQSAAFTAGVIPKKSSKSHATERVRKKSVDESAKSTK